MTTFNSCTKCVGSRGIILFIRKLHLTSMWLDYFLDIKAWRFKQPGIDRRPVDWCRNWISVLQSRKFMFTLYNAFISSMGRILTFSYISSPRTIIPCLCRLVFNWRLRLPKVTKDRIIAISFWVHVLRVSKVIRIH